MNYLSIDIGSTGCKSQLFAEDGRILKYVLKEYELKRCTDGVYVDIERVVENLKSLIRESAEEYEFSSIAISSFGESFVLLDECDRVLFPPMIYTDPRGDEEANTFVDRSEEIFRVTGTVPQSMFSAYKLLWIKNNRPEIFARGKKAMLICDYLGYVLTGEAVIDYALASRTGVFDIRKKCFSKEILDMLGLDNIFSQPQMAGTVVGQVRDEIKQELGIDWQCTLVLGAHDQVCAALGAGVLDMGDAVDGMGTVECITVLYDRAPEDIAFGRMGYAVAPYALEDTYCTYLLNYSCGSAVNWLRKDIMHGYSGEAESFFEYMDERMGDEPSGICVLPYFGGAATPYNDINARAAIIGVTSLTEDHTLYRAVLEGTAMEMRLNAEAVKPYGIDIKSAVAAGGGAKSARWLQIKADIQNIPIKSLASSEGGLCGCAMLQAVAMGACKDLREAREIFVRYKEEFKPAHHSDYDEQYRKYEKVYFAVKELM